MRTEFIQRSISIDERDFRLQTFADAEGEFNRHFNEEDDGSVPEPPLYGCLWPSAEGLARHLSVEGHAFKGLKVLEIGCGLGLPSLLCAALGAEVTAMDHHPAVQRLLGLNAQLNGLTPIRFVRASFVDPSIDLGRFPLIIASDILYEPGTYAALESFILRHASGDARIVLADPGRYAVERFGSALRARGDFRLVPQIVPGDPQPIEIRTFQLRKAQLPGRRSA